MRVFMCTWFSDEVETVYVITSHKSKVETILEEKLGYLPDYTTTEILLVEGITFR